MHINNYIYLIHIIVVEVCSVSTRVSYLVLKLPESDTDRYMHWPGHIPTMKSMGDQR